MDTIPEEFLTGAQPLAYVVGTVPRIDDVARKVIDVISDSCNDAESLKPVRFTIQESYDYVFRSKKAGSTSSTMSSLTPLSSPNGSNPAAITSPPSAHHSLPSPPPSSSSSSSLAGSKVTRGVDGIFKKDWLHKHHSLLPSVVLMVYEFGLDWSSEQFLETQGLISEIYSCIKSQVSGRDCKVVLVLLKAGSLNTENSVIEERLQSIRKKCNIDSKLLFSLTEQDITVPLGTQSAKSRQLGKCVRELSNVYYKYHRKNFKRLDKLGGKIMQPLHYARYNLKAAVYCDFLGQTDTSLKHLQDSYFAMANFYESIQPVDIDQVEIVSGWLNYRICRILLYTASVTEVSQQFRSHLNSFGKNYRGLNEWRHYRWLGEQYLIHEALLHTHPVTSPQHTDRAYYFLNAAQNLSKSFTALQAAMKMQNIVVPPGEKTLPKSLEEELMCICPSGWEIVKAPYYSGLPFLQEINGDQIDVLSDEGMAIVSAYNMKMEALRDPDYSSSILAYLNKALQGCIDASRAGSVINRRQQSYINYLIGEQHLLDLRYDLALSRLRPLCAEAVTLGWKGMAIPLLRKAITCAVHLDDYTTYIYYGLNLCALLSETSSDERNCLCKDIWSAVTTLDSLREMKKSFYHFKSFPAPVSNIPLMKVDELTYPIVLTSSSKAPIFTTNVQFTTNPPTTTISDCPVGTALTCTLTLKSLFEADISFNEMHVYFTNHSIVHKFTHVEEAQSIQCPIGIKSESLAEAMSVQDVASSGACVYAHKRSLSFMHNASREYVMRSEINGNVLKCIDGDVLSIAKIVLFVTSPPENFTAPLSSSSSMNLIGESAECQTKESELNVSRASYQGCTTVIEVFTPSKIFLSIKSTNPDNLKLVELRDAVGDYAPANVKIEGPKSKLTLVSPSHVEILQGIIQRVDIKLCSNADAIRNGTVEFSTDLVPRTLDASLLWYPELSPSCEGLVDLDKLIFHPLVLPKSTNANADDLTSGMNSDNDRSSPSSLATFSLPESPPNSNITVPIFVRSEALGALKIKICLRYSPSFSGGNDSTLSGSTTVSKSFELSCDVVRPIGVSFNLSSNRNANCGVSSEMASNSVLRGDEFSLTSSITCVRACKNKLGITDIALNLPEDGDLSFEIKDRNAENESKGIEVRSESKETANNIKSFSTSSLSPMTTLSHKESFSTCVDVYCLKESTASIKPQLPCASKSATIGTLSILWRLEDPYLLFPASTCTPSSLSSLEDVLKHSNILPLSGNMQQAVNKDISSTRTCNMNFAIPRVQVIDAPFDISLHAPSTLLFGETATVTINLYNKLLSSERISVSCETADHILISGFVKTSICVSSKSSSKVEFSIVPLQLGQLCLPKITLFWERHNLNIMEVGGSSSGSSKTIYVRPKGVEQ